MQAENIEEKCQKIVKNFQKHKKLFKSQKQLKSPRTHHYFASYDSGCDDGQAFAFPVPFASFGRDDVELEPEQPSLHRDASALMDVATYVNR